MTRQRPRGSKLEFKIQARPAASAAALALFALSCAAAPTADPKVAHETVAPKPAPVAAKPAPATSAGDAERELNANVVVRKDEPAADDAPSAARELPSRCAEVAGADPQKPAKAAKCFPPKEFVDQLCSNVHPSTSLHLFHKAAPWTHAFLKTKTKAWNAARRGTSTDSWLARHEEVLLLAEQESAVDGGAAGFTALRWDGNCVFLTQAELMDYRPWQPPSARLDWDKFEPSLKEALRKDPTIQDSYRKQRQACRGLRSGTQDTACQGADEHLSLGIAEYVRRGGELPALEHAP